MAGRTGLFVVLAIAWACACGTGKDADNVESPVRREGTGQEIPNMANDSPERLIVNTVAKNRGIRPDQVEVEILAGADVPGIVVFSAKQAGVPGPMGTYDAGIVDGDAVIFDRADAMARVAKAWGYGAERTVPPARVAKVMGFLEGMTEGTLPLVTEDDLRLIKKTFHKPFADRAALPAEITVDGLPAVQYGNRGDGRPFWISTAIFHPDGKVEIRNEEIPL